MDVVQWWVYRDKPHAAYQRRQRHPPAIPVQHGTLSTVDGAIALRYATYIDIAAELRRRAKEYEDAMFVSGTAPSLGGLWRSQLPQELRDLAQRLERVK